MNIYNTLTKTTDEFNPIHKDQVRIYSCGPTVYDHIHIGNLSSFIYADTLSRTLRSNSFKTRHIMNFTDVDDKTIKRSHETYPDLAPMDALEKLTRHFSDVFMKDMQSIGNDTSALEFIRATDSIEGIRQLIQELFDDGFAYVTEDGVYFSIDAYKKSGKNYGQLSKISAGNTSHARIDNDEYDKDNVHDFALWKVRKENEPAWPFELGKHDLTGRPGWHIECSVMSVSKLGQPFDIHTGGIDLIFPHHENEIAQSTAGDGELYAKFFFHNEHLLVEGKKMSKSLNNFYTLEDINKKGFDPLAFRLMVLQSHYRNQSNFTWDILKAAQTRLNGWQATVNLGLQLDEAAEDDTVDKLKEALYQDLDTPKVLALISEYFDSLLNSVGKAPNSSVIKFIEDVLGIKFDHTDINSEIKELLKQRAKAREKQDWELSDKLRDELKQAGIGVGDSPLGQIWYRLFR